MRTTSSGFISGEVQIEGVNKPLNFIIDTGASISVLSDKLAGREELASFREGVRMRVFGAAGVEEDVKTLVLPRVLVGTHSQRGVSAAVLDLDSINETTGFEQTGIIGGNFLFNYRITFDFKRGVLRLETQPGGGNGPAPGPTSTVAARQ
jgi:predicted aspartyl protease